mgnify:CR=1 FL=1
MAMKVYKPRSPGRRNMTGYDFSDITKTTPEKALEAAKTLHSSLLQVHNDDLIRGGAQ